MLPYVYALVDPRDGATFYIGKGSGRRMYQHEHNARRGKDDNQAKMARIREILSAGLRVVCRVLAEFQTDAEAFAAERRFIAEHVALTNRNSGGGGSRIGSPEVRDLQANLRKAEDLIAHTMPYMDWINERPRTNQESELYHLVVAELHHVRDWCRTRLADHA